MKKVCFFQSLCLVFSISCLVDTLLIFEISSSASTVQLCFINMNLLILTFMKINMKYFKKYMVKLNAEGYYTLSMHVHHMQDVNIKHKQINTIMWYVFKLVYVLQQVEQCADLLQICQFCEWVPACVYMYILMYYA